MKVLAVIPARGGSKGVKDKNIREVLGKPLLAYSIEVAQRSKKIDQFVVNTDSDKIAKVAQKFKAEVFFRSDDLGTDTAAIAPVLLEMIDAFASKNQKFDLLILLQTTSPLRTAEDIDNVVEMFERDNKLENVVSVIKIDDGHPARMYSLNNQNSLIPNQPKGERKRRQDLAPLYIRNGCIYAIKVDALKQSGEIILPKKQAYIMPFEYALNIDSERDLLIAEILMSEWLNKQKNKGT